MQDDPSRLRVRAVDAASRFLAEHQDVFGEAEDASKARRERRLMLSAPHLEPDTGDWKTYTLCIRERRPSATA